MFSVGFALHSKKARRYLTDRVLSLAAEHGLEIHEIDQNVPLTAQGPFHLIVHKLNSDSADWEKQLKDYSAAHPEVIVVDAVDRVNVLRNRDTMLSTLPKLSDGFVCSLGEMRVFVPRQMELSHDTSVQDVLMKMAELQMKWPLLLKPKWADGRPGCHMLGFIGNQEGLETALNPGVHSMKPPFIAQQIIPHDAIVYKVYVVGDRVICSVRPSLELSKCQQDFQMLPRISSKARSEVIVQGAPPPEELTTLLARSLQQTLKLRLFNFDLIRHSEHHNIYFVIDINYFPGIDKIENFEQVFVEFLFKTCSL